MSWPYRINVLPNEPDPKTTTFAERWAEVDGVFILGGVMAGLFAIVIAATIYTMVESSPRSVPTTCSCGEKR